MRPLLCGPWLSLCGCALLLFSSALSPVRALEPIPDRLVVLTFDDSVASHYRVVRPTLKRLGFNATFFITEGFSFRTNKQDYMTWEQIRELHDDGFEIGNHTRDHLGVSTSTLPRLREQIDAINARCAEYGIPRPTSFAYPGNAITPGALPLLQELGFRFARRGGSPEHPYEWGRGFAYEPGSDHPLLLPSAGDARPDWTLADFRRAADQARDGRIAVLQFHGVPDRDHPWVHTRPEAFEQFMSYLHTNRFQVVALRDLARYVDPTRVPSDVLAIVKSRQASRDEILVEGETVDDASGKPLPARLSIRGSDGAWHFPKSASGAGSAIRYERRNGSNPKAVEMHTTLSAHPFKVELRPGRYTFIAERGKEFFPVQREFEVGVGQAKVELRLRRWIDMAQEGWFSGDAHNHRDPAELPNVMLAEDVNVALPMVDWTTASLIAPSASPLSSRQAWGDEPIAIDATHAWQPRNTEYEIFRTGPSNHMLGAIVILNHRTRFDQTAFPLKAVAAQAHREGALLDLEKHNWPWSMALVPILPIDLFELANNHHWQTEYSVRNWAVPAPAWMGLPGSGTDTERGWTLYGFQTYYALLNCGFPLRPSAGTANGAHPVPLAFSRVYVHLEEPFSLQAWMRGLGAGRSFVTTGPMIRARVNGVFPGVTFPSPQPADGYRLDCVISSEQLLESIELIVNGEIKETFGPGNTKTPAGAYESRVVTQYSPKTTSWLAWRCFEQRPGQRFRFAHSAPWFFAVPGQPLRPRREQAEWLVTRVREEMERSRAVVPASLMADYQQALETYEQIARTAR